MNEFHNKKEDNYEELDAIFSKHLSSIPITKTIKLEFSSN